MAKVLVKDNLVVMINASDEFVSAAYQSLQDFATSLKVSNHVAEDAKVVFEALNEGFKTSSKVQYCALTGDFSEEGYKYSGYMKVMQTIMSLDYMWKEVRIKGGAYGGFAGFRKSGVFYMGSYRDPNLADTYNIYKGLPAYIRNIAFDERELSKYIIGTVSNLIHL